MKKRGQVTIFIIIAIVIIVVVALFFLFRGASTGETGERNAAENLNPALRMCISDKVEEGVELLIQNGGYIAPTLRKPFKFSDENEINYYTYLCYNLNRGKCVPQQPNLIVHSENELKGFIEDDLKKCFGDALEDIKKEGYIIDEQNFNDFEIELKEGELKIVVDADVTTSKGDETFSQSGFEMNFKNNLYEMANLAREIINSEAGTCSFNEISYMTRNPRTNIRKFVAEDDAKIYVLTHYDGDKFRFAILGC